VRWFNGGRATPSICSSLSFRQGQRRGIRNSVRSMCGRCRSVIACSWTDGSCSTGRAKTGRAGIGTLSRRTERLLTEYLAGTERLLDAVLFRMRTGSPYREATLAHDLPIFRELVFPGDTAS
jgi:hypothetical protein